MSTLKLAVGVAALSFITGLTMGYNGKKEEFRAAKAEFESRYVAEHPQQIVFINSNKELEDKENRIRTALENNYKLDVGTAQWYASIISVASYHYEIPENIMMALIATESTFRTDQVSSADAVGPAQVVASQWPELGYNMKDPAQNILAGAYVLSTNKEQCGNWNCALKAYNVGMTAHRKGKREVKAAEIRYINKINKNLNLVALEQKNRYL